MQDITKIPVDAVRRIKLSPASELALRSTVLVMFFDINPIMKNYPFLFRTLRACLVCPKE